MPIIRTEKDKDHYARIHRDLLQDAALTYEARGLAAYLLSRPADWEIEVNDLIPRSPDGKDKVYRILGELARAGYLVKSTTRERGRFSATYTLYESKQLAGKAAPSQSESETAAGRAEENRCRCASPKTGVLPPASKFTLAERERYARAHRLGTGWVIKAQSGTYDEFIEREIRAADSSIDPTVLAIDIKDCPDCYGSGWQHHAGGNSVSRCHHLTLLHDEEFAHRREEVKSKKAKV